MWLIWVAVAAEGLYPRSCLFFHVGWFEQPAGVCAECKQQSFDVCALFLCGVCR